ncbi:MAG: ribosome maturation factor RimP [Myxococcota bacterium]|nr:ribosome maturation factor RimP [Myxococcota bacterium]
MVQTEATEAAIRQLVRGVVEPMGMRLVDVRLHRRRGSSLLQILLEREGADPARGGSGVSIADCQAVSRALSRWLDEPAHADLVEGPYDLEVSSAGLDRPLVEAADYERFAGRPARVETHEPIAGRRRFYGTLRGIDGSGVVRLQIADGAEVHIPLERVRRAHLVHRFEG